MITNIKLTADTSVYAKWNQASTKIIFNDVAQNAYYYDAVICAVENEITSGTSETTFAPEATCSRAQAATFLWRMMGSPKPTGTTNPFNDVSPSAYYYDALLWARENGIIAGTSTTSFSPDATVTRAQVSTFLWRAVNSPAASKTAQFDDVAEGAYYKNAVDWAKGNGITSGTSTTSFSPTNPCTCAQIMTFLYRYQR